jgi:CHASE2 domain-containing sensor protein
MIDGDKRQPAPASPFLLAPGQVLGRTDEATEDRFITPYAWPWMQAPDMAGVEVQAHAIDALLVGALQAPP